MPVLKMLIRLLAFFSKELHEIRRQPRLVLSLLLGPMLILIIFGIGYYDKHPPLKTIMVVPENVQGSTYIQDIQNSLGDYFNLVDVNNDIGAAVVQLNEGKVDLVEVIPPNIENRIQNREPVSIDFMYNQINPQEERYYHYIAYIQIEAINEAILANSISVLQKNSSDTKVAIDRVRNNLDLLQAAPNSVNIGRTRDSMQALIILLDTVTAGIQSQNSGGASADNVVALRNELEQLDQELGQGQVDQSPQRFDNIRQRLDQAETEIDKIQGKSAYDIINPIHREYANLQGEAVSLTVFFAPSVVALILQHIAVTLGALSLVRERMRGSIEFFGVTPASNIEVLMGKYLAYLLYLLLIAAGLFALLVFGLKVPFRGDVWQGILFLLVFLLASIGVGFLVSVLSNSDTQAVQLSMLVLLFSVFFSGFILPAYNLIPAVRFLGDLAPMTQGLMGFQNIMLMGTQPSLFSWRMMILITLVTFIIVLFFWSRQFRKLD